MCSSQRDQHTSDMFVPICLCVNLFVYSPDPETRVILRSPEDEAGPDHYINANYIRVRFSQYIKLTQVTLQVSK